MVSLHLKEHLTKMQWYALRSKLNKEEALWREGARGLVPECECEAGQPSLDERCSHTSQDTYLWGRGWRMGQSEFTWLPFGRGLGSFGNQPAAVPPPAGGSDLEQAG